MIHVYWRVLSPVFWLQVFLSGSRRTPAGLQHEKKKVLWFESSQMSHLPPVTYVLLVLVAQAWLHTGHVMFLPPSSEQNRNTILRGKERLTTSSGSCSNTSSSLLIHYLCWGWVGRPLGHTHTHCSLPPACVSSPHVDLSDFYFKSFQRFLLVLLAMFVSLWMIYHVWLWAHFTLNLVCRVRPHALWVWSV